MKHDTFYFAVRESDEKEWVDINTWGHESITSKEKAKKVDDEISLWAMHNQVARIAQFTLTENCQ